MYATKLDKDMRNAIDNANELVDDLVQQAETVYGLFYEMDVQGIDYSKIANIDECVNVFKMYPDLVRHMENRRQDLYFSDREIAALAYVLYSDFAPIVQQRKALNEMLRMFYKFGVIEGIY